MKHFQDFLHFTFSPMVAGAEAADEDCVEVTFHQKDKILLSPWRS